MTDRILLDAMTSDQLDDLYDQLERAQRVAMDVLDDGPLERVRNLHQPMQRGALTICAHCSHWDANRQRCHGVLTDYPCDTVTALDARPEPDTSEPEPTPSQRAGLRDEIAAAIFECPAGYPTDIADAVLPVLDRARPWLRAEAEDAALDPDGLRERYADAVECAIGLNVNCGGTEGVHRVRDAVLAVRDRRMEQLTAGRATWKAKAEEIERHRDRLAATLDEVLRHFVHPGHPGEPCLQTGWISVKTVDRWRAALNPPKEPTP